MATVKRDDVKQKWEETEFPLVCETCLGDNAYVRMTKEAHGKKCKVCETPFTVFAWQAGSKGRVKRVEICKTCARSKNVCQVCIYDLQYGLPVKMRDRVLKENGATGAIGAVPQSMANRSWHQAQQERLLENGQNGVGEANALAHAQLQSIARMEPRYERNLAKLCSFFARGECNRGDTCPFRHEMPRDRNDPMSKQNTKDRFYGSSDPVAGKMYARMKRKQEEEKKGMDAEGKADGFERARATLYLRFQGDAPYPVMTENDIRDSFYSFGEISKVKCMSDKGQAFIEYTQPEATELAVVSMNKKEMMGRKLFVSWARVPKRGNTASSKGPRKMARRDEGPRTCVPATKSLPGGGSKAKVPSGFVVKKRSGLANVPRPGGGSTGGSSSQYPSADPGRLGSKPGAAKASS